MWGRSSCAYVCEGDGRVLIHARFRFFEAIQTDLLARMAASGIYDASAALFLALIVEGRTPAWPVVRSVELQDHSSP